MLPSLHQDWGYSTAWGFLPKLSTTHFESSLSGSSIAFLSITKDFFPVRYEMIESPCWKSANFFSQKASTERFSSAACFTKAILAGLRNLNSNP